MLVRTSLRTALRTALQTSIQLINQSSPTRTLVLTSIQLPIQSSLQMFLQLIARTNLCTSAHLHFCTPAPGSARTSTKALHDALPKASPPLRSRPRSAARRRDRICEANSYLLVVMESHDLDEIDWVRIPPHPCHLPSHPPKGCV